MNTVTCFILFQGLTAHTHQCDVKRVFDLVLETEVEDVLLSCAVEACNILEHMEPLSLFLPTVRSCDVRLHGGDPTDEWAAKRCARTDSEDTRSCINTVTYTFIPKGFAMPSVPTRPPARMWIWSKRKSTWTRCHSTSCLTPVSSAMPISRSSLVEELMLSFTFSSTHVGEGYCCNDDVDRVFRVWRRLRVSRASQTKSCTTHSLTFVRSTWTWTRVCDSWVRYEQRVLLPPTTRPASDKALWLRTTQYVECAMCWEMLPLTTKCVWDESSSSVARTIEVYYVECVGEC